MRDLGTVLSFLAASLQGKVNDGRPPNEFERQKLIDMMQSIFEQSSPDELTAGPMMNPLGYAVLALLGSLAPNLSVSIRASAILAVLCLVEKIKDCFAVLSTLLPATCSQMSKIVGNVEKEPHQLTVASVKILHVLLMHGVPQRDKIPLVFEQNLGAILLVVLKAAQSTKDSRVLEAIQEFAKALNDSVSLEPLTHLTLQLGCATNVQLPLRGSQIGAAKGLYLSTKERAEDVMNPMESRIAAVSLAAYLEEIIPEDVAGCMELVVGLVSEQVCAERSKKASAIVPVSNLLSLNGSVANRLPPVFGPDIDSTLLAFDRIKNKTLESVMTHKEKNPATCLLLLGRSSSVSTAETIIDCGLQILLDHADSDQLTSCAYMHMLVDVAAVLGGEQFDPYWRYCMMDFLTWIASPDSAVSSYAYTALQLIGQSYGSEPSPVDLIRNHLDHVLDQLGLQIRCPTVYPLAPRILTALLTIIGPSFAINDILVEVLDNLRVYRGHDGYVYELLGVISASAKSLVPHIKLVAIPKEDECDEDAVLSVEQRTAETMIKVVVHFVLSDRRKIRLRSLQTLSDLALAFETNRDAYLPLVHLTWPAVLGRVSEADRFVAEQALSTIGDMATIAGDFMQSGVNQELWPLLKHSSHLTSSVLQLFSRLSLLMKLSLKTIQGLCGMLVQCLKVGSPQALKEAAFLMGDSLAKSSPDVLWFVLHCQVDQTQSHIDNIDTRPYKTLTSSQFSQLSLPHLQHLLQRTSP